MKKGLLQRLRAWAIADDEAPEGPLGDLCEENGARPSALLLLSLAVRYFVALNQLIAELSDRFPDEAIRDAVDEGRMTAVVRPLKDWMLGGAAGTLWIFSLPRGWSSRLPS